MYLDDYMSEFFPSLVLRPPLFYNWDIGIRFELGVEWSREYISANNPYLQGVYHRAVTLFKALHSPDEELFVVVDVNDFGDGKAYQHKGRILSPYVCEKALLFQLKHTKMPYVFPEDDEDGKYKTHRFALTCKTSDLKYIPLLKAVCNQDLGIQPSIFHRIYFINMNKKTIFHVYDDRGCDILATSPESIREVYQRYSDWILDYDREDIEKVF
ncbi:DUF3885 domain-containing protein [Bacillus sp. MRMR6]|uniref:DUF3885 domain-containing protein n=1 Tax=Bacillus sp. MRMR6 TaxID=1928617 RepID=UPI0009533551|nr:DUF3885 domain-containing protein [Bacillus sp. MRMR6]OLS40114.1 hypothetical protein BTR25_11225 [Bacillus sp. MRMR6]